MEEGHTYTYRSEDNLQDQFSPSTMWVPGVELWSSSLEAWWPQEPSGWPESYFLNFPYFWFTHLFVGENKEESQTADRCFG